MNDITIEESEETTSTIVSALLKGLDKRSDKLTLNKTVETPMHSRSLLGCPVVIIEDENDLETPVLGTLSPDNFRAKQ